MPGAWAGFWQAGIVAGDGAGFWRAGIVAITGGRLLGVLATVLGFGVSSSSPHVPRHLASMCNLSTNFNARCT